MKRIILPFFFLTFLASTLSGQISIDTITTDTVDIFSPSVTTTSNISSAALWSSLVLPGIGHQMSNRPKGALAYLSVDVLSLFSAIVLHQLSQKYTSNSRAMAHLHAKIGEDAPSDEYFWQLVGSFKSYDDYITAYPVEFRKVSDKYIDQKCFWNWGSDTLLRSDYVHMQDVSKQLSTISSFFIGAMVLNRLVAFIDLRSTARNRRFTQLSSLSFTPIVKSSSKGIALSTSF